MEAQQTVDIFNKLFSLKVDDNYFEGWTYGPDEAWLIACNTEGNIIQSEELQNGETINIDRQDRTDEELTVTLINIYIGKDNDRYASIESYQDIAPNAWFLRGYTRTEESVIGTAAIAYIVPGGMQTLATASNANMSLSMVDESHQASLDILKEPAGLFIANNAQDGSSANYAWLDDIRVDQQYDLNAEDFKPMKLMQQVSVPPADDLYFTISGSNEQVERYYNLFRFDHQSDDEVPSQLSIHTPEGLFNDYYHYVRINRDGITYSHVGNDVLKDAYVVPEVSADIANLGKEQVIQIQGEYESDFARGRWAYFDFIDGLAEGASWYVHSSVNEKQYRAQLHEIPAQIIDRHPFVGNALQDMEYKSTTLYNYDSIASLSDYLVNRYQADIEPMFGAREEISIRATDSQGGRTMGGMPESFAEKIEALRQHR